MSGSPKMTDRLPLPVLFAAQALALRQAGHHLERIAEDHAVGPVLVVLVEVGLVRVLGHAVEIGEQVELLLLARSLVGRFFLGRRLPQQIVDQDLRMDLFLDVQRRGVDDKAAPVLLILPAPDQLRIEVTVAAFVGNADRALLFLFDDGLIFRRGDVLPLVRVMRQSFDGLLRGFLGHSASRVFIFLPSMFLPKSDGKK
jgi:hypothetical protein